MHFSCKRAFEEDLSKNSVKKLKRVAFDFTSTALKAAMEKELANLGVLNRAVTSAPVNPIIPDTDPQTLRIAYHSLLDSVPNIADNVKLRVKRPFVK